MNSGQPDNDNLAALQAQVSQAAMAAADAGEGAQEPMASMLILRIGPRWLALPAGVTREVVLKGLVTRVPLAPPHLLGVAMIRSKVVPVISLEAALGTAAAADLVPTLPRLVVMETEEAELALCADEVREIAELAISSLVDNSTASQRPVWVSAELTWKDLLICVLDVPRLIAAFLGEDN